MDLKSDLFKRSEKTWVLLTTKPQKLQFSPLIGTIDLYNHQHLTRLFKTKKLNLSFGEKTLLSSSNLLPAKRIVVFGLGTGQEVSKSEVQELIAEVNKTVADLLDQDTFVAISENANPELIELFKKKFPSHLVG